MARLKDIPNSVCSHCGKPFYRHPSLAPGKHCSRVCQSSALRTPEAIEARFWSLVDRRAPDECWEWKGSPTKHGYGRFEIGGHKHRFLMLAHRYAYELAYGPIPEGMNACHTCDNPPCCNPAHLFPGTQADNIDDMFAKGRNPEIDGYRGESHHLAKLTADSVRSIRILYATGTYTQRQLAGMFGISQTGIGAIVRRECWKGLPD